MIPTTMFQSSTHLGQHQQQHSMMEGVKQLLMTMFAMNNLSQTYQNTQTSTKRQSQDLFSLVYHMLLLGLIEQIVKYFPYLFHFTAEMLQKKIHWIPSNQQTNLAHQIIHQKKKMSSITIHIATHLLTPNTNPHSNGSNAQQFHYDVGVALLDYVTNHSHTQSVEFIGGIYLLNDKQSIEIGDSKQEIFCRMISKDNSSPGEYKTDKTSHQTIIQTVEVYSFALHMEELRQFLNELTYLYNIKMQNKLGNKIYYFSEIPVFASPLIDGIKDYSRLPPHFFFTMKPFHTFKKLSNLFGPEIDIIRNRVLFFKNNRKWYEDKGIPYTLGLLLSGQPGSGKTSVIKCLANELQRHVINISLHEDITKTQMDHLFYNETITVNNGGVQETFKIPLDKRIYVLEDVDCQSDIVLEREPESSSILPIPGPVSESSQAHFQQEQATSKPPQKEFEYKEYNDLYYNPYDLQYENLLKPTTSSINKKSPSSLSFQDNKENTKNESPSKLSLSYLLNLLDGILEIPGRIVIMTANYPDRLDRALVRPGRIDVVSKFTKCTNKTVCELIEHFYDVSLTDKERDGIHSFQEYQWYPAELQKILFENFYSYLNALECLRRMNDTHAHTIEPIHITNIRDTEN